MRLKTILVCTIFTLVTGCGTVTTVMRQESVARNTLKEYGSYCKSIPRIYSGVSYDVCKLYGTPDPYAHSSSAVPGLVMDILFSSALDTVVLPYTLYTQVKRGSIPIQ